MDKDDESELRNMIFHADVKQADCWSHGHARTVEQHPAIPRSVCGDRTGALSTTNLIALFASSSQGFFDECLKLADSDRNVDLYHWSSAKFSSTWYDTLSVLVAKGRARVSVAASEADWSKRIREMQYADYEDHTVGS